MRFRAALVVAAALLVACDGGSTEPDRPDAPEVTGELVPVTPRWTLVATHRTDQDAQVPMAALVAAVSDPALGPRVDAAYVAAGRALPSGGEG